MIFPEVFLFSWFAPRAHFFLHFGLLSFFGSMLRGSLASSVLSEPASD